MKTKWDALFFFVKPGKISAKDLLINDLLGNKNVIIEFSLILPHSVRVTSAPSTTSLEQLLCLIMVARCFKSFLTGKCPFLTLKSLEKKWA
jgi:hypothetical protein